MNGNIANEEGTKAEESLTLAPLDLPVELLSMVLAHLTDAKDIVNVQLVNSKFYECASWDGVSGIRFFILRDFSGRKLSMRSATPEFFFESECLRTESCNHSGSTAKGWRRLR